MKRRLLLLILLMLLLSIPILPARAQAPERSEAFVYAVTAYDGLVYQSAFVPPNIETLYLMAGVENVLAARDTLIYFWDLTNRYEPDWLAKNIPIEGTLEISQHGKQIAEVHPTDYVIQYDTEQPIETRALFTGQAAVDAYARFLELQNDYRDASYLYYTLLETYRKVVDEIVASGKTIPAEDFPKPPQPPAQLTLYSSEIARGYVVNLPPGSYSLTLRLPDGSLVPGSQRSLVVFTELDEGISYTIMPETRWTRPDKSMIEGSTIYTLPDNTLYLQPFIQKKYNDQAYARMLDPQDMISRRDQERWVTFVPYNSASLAVFGGEQSTIEMEGYKIVQLAGSGLGYEVRPFDPESMDSSSFEGFKISLTSNSDAVNIFLLDKNGNMVPGSRREVRTLYTDRSVGLYALSLLPILAGLVAHFARSRWVKRIKVEG